MVGTAAARVMAPTTPVPAAFAAAGATAVELGADQRPLLVRFAGLPAGSALATVAGLYGVAAADLAPTSTTTDALGMRHDF